MLPLTAGVSLAVTRVIPSLHVIKSANTDVRAEWLQSLSSSKTDSRCIKMMISFNYTINKRSKSTYTSFCES